MELDYYNLYLRDYVRKNHPERIPEVEFIQVRAEQASTMYEQSRLNGYTPEGAQEIAKNATTSRQYTRIGELYGFPIYVISELVLKDGISVMQNRFVVEGHYKYRYNNGQVAMSDTKAAAMNLLNALEHIPQILEQYKAKNENMEKDLPVLREIVGSTWKKEDNLECLKQELKSLERKINLTLLCETQKHLDKDVSYDKITEKNCCNIIKHKKIM